MRNAPLSPLISCLTPALLLASAALAQSAPPAPTPAGQGAPAPWACDRKTLLSGEVCTFEGATTAQPASREQAKEIQRDARALLLDACAELARGEPPDALEPDPALVALCTARADAAVRVCGGDGSKRLRDDAGRFNAGHARCYASLRAVLEELSVIQADAAQCCGCTSAQCGAPMSGCTERLVKGALPDGACAETCAASCAGAAARLAKPPKAAAKGERR
jgi:hypothetical protein